MLVSCWIIDGYKITFGNAVSQAMSPPSIHRIALRTVLDPLSVKKSGQRQRIAFLHIWRWPITTAIEETVTQCFDLCVCDIKGRDIEATATTNKPGTEIECHITQLADDSSISGFLLKICFDDMIRRYADIAIIKA